MTIKEKIAITKEADKDISGIKVSIKNNAILDFFDEPSEEYFGELSDIPEKYLECEVIGQSQICQSSVPGRVGAYILVVNTIMKNKFEKMSPKEIEYFIISELKEKDTMSKEEAGYITYHHFLTDAHMGESNKYHDVLFGLDEDELEKIWKESH